MKIKDLTTGQIFEYGSNTHHSLRISDGGRMLSFENLQNGDGSQYGDYRFIDDNEEKIPDEIESEYGCDCYFNIGGFDNKGSKHTDEYIKGYNKGTIDRADEIQRVREYGYNKAIDEFAEKMKTNSKLGYIGYLDKVIDEIAEQLKGGSDD